MGEMDVMVLCSKKSISDFRQKVNRCGRVFLFRTQKRGAAHSENPK